MHGEVGIRLKLASFPYTLLIISSYARNLRTLAPDAIASYLLFHFPERRDLIVRGKASAATVIERYPPITDTDQVCRYPIGSFRASIFLKSSWLKLKKWTSPLWWKAKKIFTSFSCITALRKAVIQLEKWTSPLWWKAIKKSLELSSCITAFRKAPLWWKARKSLELSSCITSFRKSVVQLESLNDFFRFSS